MKQQNIKVRSIIKTGIFLLTLMFLSVLCFSQVVTTGIFNNLLKPALDLIKKWELLGFVKIIFILLTGIIGIIIAAMQKINKKWVKMCVVILGVVVSIFTLILNTYFIDDYNSMAKKANKEMVSINKKIIAFQFLPESATNERSNILDEIEISIKSIYDIELDAKLSFNNENKNDIFWGPCLYAQDKGVIFPDWLNKTPTNNNYLYYIGLGINSNLSNAKELSLEDSKNQAKSNLMPLISNNVKSPVFLASYLIRYLDIEDSFIYSSQSNGLIIFNYYSLIRLNKKMLSTGLSLFEMSRQTKVNNKLQIQQSLQQK